MPRMLLILVALTLTAADPAIRKEPAYRAVPHYGQLTFSDADRVWLAWDGDVLHVDRNGNGDLTDPGERIEATKPRPGHAVEEGHIFEVGELLVGGRTHKGLVVLFTPLSAYDGGTIAGRADVKAALAKSKKAVAIRLSIDAEVPGLTGAGIGKRLTYTAGPFDLEGVLQFSVTAATAPVIRIGGPLQLSFYAERPTLRIGTESEFVMVVGTPGVGPGTFAMLGYDETIPKSCIPTAEVEYPPTTPGDPPVREKYELKQRC